MNGGDYLEDVMNYEDMTKAELIAALKLIQSTGTAEGHIIGYIDTAQDITTRGQVRFAAGRATCS